MGDLKDQFFLQYINSGLDKVRDSLREEYTPKKGRRFLIQGLTYELSVCRKVGTQYVFEISSKIPKEILPRNVKIEKYFDSVVKIVNKGAKKPSESKMESITQATVEEDLKERDYVKLTYSYAEDELYSNEDLTARMEKYRAENTPIPLISGVLTPGGRVVLILIKEAIEASAKENILSLCSANEEIKKVMKEKAKNQPAAKSAKKVAKKKTAKK